ncbi:hypothetical protein SNK03_008734 [Fusarium graminearum]
MLEAMKIAGLFEVGDQFVVCDADGGTVDIITYKIEKLTPFVVSESVRGDGGLCGGIFLDQKFLGLLRRKFPKDITRMLAREAAQRIVKDDWESGIKTVICKESGKYEINLVYKGPVDPQFSPSSFALQADEIREQVYKPVIEEIKELITTQIRQVEEGYQKPPKSAVLRGAVLHALSRTGLADSITAVVDSRISRHNYGTVFNDCPFDIKKHDIRDREYCPYGKNWIAADQTEWYIGIGDAVSIYKPASFSCYQALTNPDQGLQIEIVISDSAEPPARRDESVKRLCLIKVPLPSKVWGKLRKEINEDGKAFRRINYDLRMISDGSSLEFAIWFKEQCLASQYVEFESTQMQKEEATDSGGEADAEMMEPEESVSVIEVEDDTDDEYMDCPDREDESTVGDHSTVRGRHGSLDDDFLSE